MRLQDTSRLQEYFQTQVVPQDNYVILRIDGRNFTRLTNNHFDKPFDVAFHNTMLSAAEFLMADFQGIYCYVQSDEINLLLPRGFNMFNRRVEKLASVSASLVTCRFVNMLRDLDYEANGISFDSRVLFTHSQEQVQGYFVDRLNNSKSNALSTAYHWGLIQNEDYTARAAGEKAKVMTREMKHYWVNEWQHTHPGWKPMTDWQFCGTEIYVETYEKVGYNPKIKQAVLASRKRQAVSIVQREKGLTFSKMVEA